MMLRSKSIPFIALNIRNLDEREVEFGVTLSRNSVELSGTITEGIARGIYDMETDKVTDLIKSRAESLREGSAGVENLKDILQRECTIFGGCDILLEAVQDGENNRRERLLVAERTSILHLELWRNRGWVEGIFQSPKELPVKVCQYPMSKKGIADLIEEGQLIAISLRYLDDYITNATGPSNGLRGEAIKAILNVLGISSACLPNTSEKLWAFLGNNREDIRNRYTKQGGNGILWIREEYKPPYSDHFEKEHIILFWSLNLNNPADPAFCEMLQEKIKRQALTDLLRVQR